MGIATARPASSPAISGAETYVRHAIAPAAKIARASCNETITPALPAETPLRNPATASAGRAATITTPISHRSSHRDDLPRDIAIAGHTVRIIHMSATFTYNHARSNASGCGEPAPHCNPSALVV